MVDVHIVGAGPGDPELITRKGYRLVQEADVVIYAGGTWRKFVPRYCSSIKTRVYIAKCISNRNYYAHGRPYTNASKGKIAHVGGS